VGRLRVLGPHRLPTPRTNRTLDPRLGRLHTQPPLDQLSRHLLRSLQRLLLDLIERLPFLRPDQFVIQSPRLPQKLLSTDRVFHGNLSFPVNNAKLTSESFSTNSISL
jgi:hypothetical protein